MRCETGNDALWRMEDRRSVRCSATRPRFDRLGCVSWTPICCLQCDVGGQISSRDCDIRGVYASRTTTAVAMMWRLLSYWTSCASCRVLGLLWSGISCLFTSDSRSHSAHPYVIWKYTTVLYQSAYPVHSQRTLILSMQTSILYKLSTYLLINSFVFILHWTNYRLYVTAILTIRKYQKCSKK